MYLENPATKSRTTRKRELGIQKTPKKVTEPRYRDREWLVQYHTAFQCQNKLKNSSRM